MFSVTGHKLYDLHIRLQCRPLPFVITSYYYEIVVGIGELESQVIC